VTDPERLRGELEEIRAQGYALTRQERRPGVISIAAPVFNRDGQVAGSINVTGSLHRIGNAETREFIALVIAAAREVSCRLGHQPENASHNDRRVRGQSASE
jgi:DNA-binding IclR family transcriptional regulator